MGRQVWNVCPREVASFPSFKRTLDEESLHSITSSHKNLKGLPIVQKVKPQLFRLASDALVTSSTVHTHKSRGQVTRALIPFVF